MGKVQRLKIPFMRKGQIPLVFLNTGHPPIGGIVLAADIGGTKTNLALFKISDGHLELLREQSFETKKYDLCIDLFNEFQVESDHKMDAICLGVAGPVIAGVVQGTNFPWKIDSKAISKALNVKSVFVINDLEANAFGLTTLKDDDFETLIAGKSISGNAAIVSPGTGLGEAGLFWDGHQYRPFASEGGHCSFSPHHSLDVEIYNSIFQKYGDVSWERLLSGQGIVDIHEFLRAYRSNPMPIWLKERFANEDPAALITKTALDGRDPVCSETLTIFLRFLAIEASQMALKLKATGGIYIGGGIVPKIIKGIDKDVFTTNFVQTGRMATLLRMMSVKVILNEKTPLFGAAMYGAMGIGADADS
ncbi:glucokinase [Gelidibacter mesophilus]|uniref:glucokinase n=1 Tax=Gelidibacter mesophilus TaxID=169050 RepID=UPI0004253310|nr:glucokinase [Gelidibacter mesophilus]